MFRKLREAIDAALEALEGKAGQAPREDIDRLLSGMRDELIDAKSRIPVLEKDLRKLQLGLERETKQADDCHRRALQAQDIGDEETVEVALRFEAKHRVAMDVWTQKIEAAEAELAMQRQNVAEMTEELKTAMARRDSLEIQARRAGSTERMRGGRRSSADEFDRLVEALERDEDLGSAQRQVDRELDPDVALDLDFDDAGVGDMPTGPSREELAEIQLEELKRRMKNEKK
jgi:phage shock protein A